MPGRAVTWGAVKAILIDPEARDPEMMSDPHFGKLREPFLKVVNLARALNASSAEGWFYLAGMDKHHVEEVLGLVAPEMQIISASSGVTAPNYFWGAVTGQIGSSPGSQADRLMKLNLEQECS